MKNMGNHNICVGYCAGEDLTTENYQLRIKIDDLGINIEETMNEREFELISKVIQVTLNVLNK
jgi:hypothetical protein